MLTDLINGADTLGLRLSPDQLNRFELYYRELNSWNLKTNLTSITDYQDVQITHFLDSLSVILALPSPIPTGLKLLDVGTGAGFPGLPLKILYPEIQLTLLEATGKKASFLEHLIGALELKEVAILNKRAEEAAHLSEYRSSFDAVVSRAVAELPTLLELTLPFCRLGGHLIAQKKGDVRSELDRTGHALEILGGEFIEIREITLPLLYDRRCLVVITKIAPTPTTYPRRPGIPAKRPLV